MRTRHPVVVFMPKKVRSKLKAKPKGTQQGSAGGEVNRQVGKRGELNSATDPDNREPETGADNPAQDAQKGGKTLAAMQDSRG